MTGPRLLRAQSPVCVCVRGGPPRSAVALAFTWLAAGTRTSSRVTDLPESPGFWVMNSEFLQEEKV